MNKEIYCQITSGRGPAEVTRAVVLVMKKLQEDVNLKGMTSELVDYEPGVHSGCMFSCVLKISGDESAVNNLIEEWEGSIQWVATRNPYREKWPRKNWFVGTSFFTPIAKSEIDMKDVKIETTRSSGPGGQNVNKVESAVRATHIPSGISVLAQDSRDQPQNKKLAIERLIAKLSAIDEAKRNNQSYEIWMNHNLLQRGNPVKKFKGDL